MKERYLNQVRLLIQLLPWVATEDCFALKGGTAINLFYHDLPRISVDIDLLYVPMDDRDQALVKIRAALTRISKLIQQNVKGVKIQNAHEQSDALRIIVQRGDVKVKIELSPVIRGAVFPVKIMPVTKIVEKELGYAEMQVASFPDLYAGKLCAALDRQHPRDLFDVKVLLDNPGLTEELRKTFIVFLISHHRPMAELLKPNFKKIDGIYESEFYEMARIEVTLPELEKAREKLVAEITGKLTDDEKKFLISFKSLNPDWKLLGMEDTNMIANLPSVRWKMANLHAMPKTKHGEAINKLESILFKFK